MIHCRVHLGLLIVWVALTVPTVLWWSESIKWLVFMSIYAIIAAHWAGWEGARAKKAVDGE